MTSNDVYIVSAVRTPIGDLNGTVSKLKASDLGSIVIKEVLKRANCSPDDVDEVIMGQALTANQGQNPARQASIQAGLSNDVPAYGLNLLCGSGLKSVCLGYQSIKAGDSKIHICGGQESMSQAPHVVHLRDGIRLGAGQIYDSLIKDGLTDAMNQIHMGVTAENLSKMFNITRQEQDSYSARSQNLAEKAQNNGWFKDEIVPVEITSRKGTVVFDKDEHIKPGVTVEQLSKLKPCFITDGSGSVTAGNASGINDSAAAVLLMSGEEVKKRGITPLAKIVAWSQTGCNPEIMGIGPVKAVTEVLKKANWTKEEVDYYELNEAFAAQSLSVLKSLELDNSKVNVNGGAIALGHPIGASGTRILVTLLYILQRTNSMKGVASLCIGGGMGIAIAVEKV